MDNYYRILGLDNFASREEIRRAYMRLAKKYHPDKNPGKPEFEDIFKRVSGAYRVLYDPVKKSAFDAALTASMKAKYSGPAYSPRSRVYTSEKREYTRTAWIYGTIFIIGFVLAAIGIPLIMFYYTSVMAYENGLEEYRKGNKVKALSELNRAVTFFGGRSAEASIKGAEICVYDLKLYEQAQSFADKGLEFASENKNIARLYFLKSIAYHGQGKYSLALSSLKHAEAYDYPRDSIQLKTGVIRAYGLLRFEDALANFEYLIQRGIHLDKAWFGKGWCLQNLDQHHEAIKSFGEVIDLLPSHPLAYYYRGLSFLSLSRFSAACADFRKALTLGLSKAEDELSSNCEASD